MTVADLFSSIVNLFTQLQIITGLSPLSLIFFLLAMWKSAKHAWSESETIVGVAAHICFYMLIWWLTGYLIFNPIWNLILGRL